MSSLIELQRQIDKLQLKMVEIKQRDFEKVVAEIITSMQSYGISVPDLVKAKKAVTRRAVVGVRSKLAQKSKKVSLRRGEAIAPKFFGPNGESWTGRGLTPRWLSSLVALGHKKEDFAAGVQLKSQ